ncbi:MAG: hypothetical protein U9Q81_02710 [Pseudomonadota bacterium]|nr:hypothetical protein [Pseudomonadota bacterium]
MKKRDDAADRMLGVRVECYAGYRAEETPRRFFLGDRALEVVNLLDRWLSPEHRYFKLRADDGGIYILRYDVALDQWELTLYDGQAGPATRLSST